MHLKLLQKDTICRQHLLIQQVQIYSPPLFSSILCDLVIDAQYSSQHFKKIYESLCVSLFKDVYSEILYDETLTFLESNGVKYYFFEAPIVSNVKNLDDFERCLLKKQIPHRKINTLPYRDILKRLFSNNTECERYLTSGEFTNFKVVNNRELQCWQIKKGKD